MSDALDKAEAAVREASTDTAAVQLAFAAMELAKLATQQQAQQPSQQHACEHQHKQGRSAGEWIGIACAVCVGSVGLAFASLAIAIAACCATGCFLILRSIWQSTQKGK
ncbi:hypothetical protein [Streptomyces sp. NBC_00878]|uniref:hypothetical protein n=1 Tax=Streptomyces sp. NBC_00878 TaxID=2975854 RepID=UPI002256FF0D|nr:hypothetical protein [Streptomyces sp. NBC_00878]MCX4906849.1 hypothetical protein [Streptomyces sp. NBC_00878]